MTGTNTRAAAHSTRVGQLAIGGRAHAPAPARGEQPWYQVCARHRLHVGDRPDASTWRGRHERPRRVGAGGGPTGATSTHSSHSPLRPQQAHGLDEHQPVPGRDGVDRRRGPPRRRRTARSSAEKPRPRASSGCRRRPAARRSSAPGAPGADAACGRPGPAAPTGHPPRAAPVPGGRRSRTAGPRPTRSAGPAWTGAGPGPRPRAPAPTSAAHGRVRPDTARGCASATPAVIATSGAGRSPRTAPAMKKPSGMATVRAWVG